MALQEGDLVQGKYRVVRIIGEGGMGSVFEGENLRINRRVAIKVLHAALASNKEVVQRFEREAQAAGRIGNDHILEVLDLGDLPDGDFFMVMEYLEGEPLSTRIHRLGRMTPQQVAPLITQVLTGLNAAHLAGIIHRDLKPDNIFVLNEKAGQKDFVKIIDFGISKFQPLGGEMKMTRTGSVMGTPYYMSPEQASGSSEADSRSDVYAVGVMMYEAVTGKVPFEATTFNQLLFKIVLDDVPKPESVVPDLDPAFASLIHKAMARDKEARFQDCNSLKNAILAWQQTGAAVSVPPPGGQQAHLPGTSRAREAFASQSGALPAPALAKSSQPSVVIAPEPLSTTTGAGSWSSEPLEIPKQSNSGMMYAAAAAGLLLLAGGAYFTFSGSSGDSEAAAAASSAAAEVKAPAAPPPAPPVKAPEPVAVVQPTVEPVVAAPAAPAAAAEPPKASSPASVKPAPAARPRPATRPTAKPATKPVAKPATGVKPMTAPNKSDTPDFGY